MILFDIDMLINYERNDSIFRLLKDSSDHGDEGLTSQRWLLASNPKRLIYDAMYGDLLRSLGQPLRVLDVGGGYTSLTKILAKKHDYYLLDIMAHDPDEVVETVMQKLARPFWINRDWSEYEAGEINDVVIANDLFPNVDQRLSQFIDKFLPVAREIRISLTFYNEYRFYKVKRIDADEIFFIVPWDGHQVCHTLEPYAERIPLYNPDLFTKQNESIFPNRRQVAMITIKGDR